MCAGVHVAQCNAQTISVERTQSGCATQDTARQRQAMLGSNALARALVLQGAPALRANDYVDAKPSTQACSMVMTVADLMELW
mmetsp:Transcript_21405/g.65124  ORF Transcript_21405/g.65124 Transcript_21405/m.65124 type:complete len:83 (+) Transcript_21405:1203-1451(+)|eukprot:scaffold304720_cov33-Tisochrysis_lutea.AAC.2